MILPERIYVIDKQGCCAVVKEYQPFMRPDDPDLCLHWADSIFAWYGTATASEGKPGIPVERWITMADVTEFLGQEEVRWGLETQNGCGTSQTTN